MAADAEKAQAAALSDKASLAEVEDGVAHAVLDAETNKKLLRRIDWRVMPVLCFTYALQFYDKALLSQAAIFGLREDLGMQDGLKYSWASLIFYFGYIAGTYPVSLLGQKFSTRIVITVITLLWSVVVLSTPACRNYGDFLANRFLLGLIEAGVSPIFMLVVGFWYTHEEQVSRSSWWYSFSGGSLLVSPLINYGMGHIQGSLSPWQYMYFIAGGVTFAWGVALWWLFPDTPQKAKGFTAEERVQLMERVRGNNAGAETNKFKWYQVAEALKDYQLWGISICAMMLCTGSGAVTVFAPIVFNGMGFNVFESLLLNLPIGALAFILILGSGYIGQMVPSSRLHVVSLSCLPVILGCALVWKLPSSNAPGRIVGYYLINFFSSGWVQCIGLGTSNVAGHTKKAVYAAVTFIAYSLGNIIGPLMFDASYAPRYDRSFTGVLICFVICFFCGEILRFFLARENKKRDAQHGPPDQVHGLEDLTDRENTSFRYHL
ncbi:MFS general substrate transporter [Trichocladium antarcticum]|uniref:MFS general substrate transporter n=1 Tax=Trichocladium antarcticum TaxID=1450529 RepID=A0AAN6UN94_9PEZI|nr:MFS general substrate transporter [Trichocladium antarcticum]